HIGVEAAQRFLEERFRAVCTRLKEAQHPAYPLILFYPSGKGEETYHSSVSVDLPKLLNQAGLTVVAAWDIHLHNATSSDRPSIAIFVCR
ncbi:MAG: hypothetical protein RMM07_14255, partial [Anaerolineae bacterium]|nr:hypothetical protein [Anaerolineae bacterium]